MPIKQWQVQQSADAIDVPVVPGASPVDASSVGVAIARELAASGAAAIPVRVQLVDKVAQTALGKTPLIVRL